MNRTEFLANLEVEVHTLETWLKHEWLVPAQASPAQDAEEERTAEPTFSDTDVARGRLLQDLTTRMGVNDEGVDVILHLLDQLHGFRRAFEDLHEELKHARTL